RPHTRAGAVGMPARARPARGRDGTGPPGQRRHPAIALPVVATTGFGGTRAADVPSGGQLPRIR
ncbi:hydrogenase expression/formation protein HypE, partial [Streptomyces rhizosphaericola]